MKTETSKHTPGDKAALRAKFDLQIAICNRAEDELCLKLNRISFVMDLDSCELDLPKLLAAPQFDFAHDVYGILRHMDRTTWPGKLKDCFLPRCWQSAKATELKRGEG